MCAVFLLDPTFDIIHVAADVNFLFAKTGLSSGSDTVTENRLDAEQKCSLKSDESRGHACPRHDTENKSHLFVSQKDQNLPQTLGK